MMDAAKETNMANLNDNVETIKKELVLYQIDLDETPGHACFFTSASKKAKFVGGFFTDGKRAFAKTKTGLVYTFDEGSRKWTKFAKVK